MDFDLLNRVLVTILFVGTTLLFVIAFAPTKEEFENRIEKILSADPEETDPSDIQAPQAHHTA